MFFSIIIPTKNEFTNLQRIVPRFKVLKGKYQYEIIIADGASNDGTIEFARSVADRVEIKIKKEPETIGEGRNRGAKVATGDILIFLDAGVLIDNPIEFFETISKVFTNKKIVAASVRVNINPQEATWQDWVVHGFINFLIWLLNTIGIGASKGECQIIRRNEFNNVGGYNISLVAGEDHELFRRLAKVGKTIFLKQLQVFDDPRRYRKLGYPRVIGHWIRNHIWVMLFKRAYDKEWKRVD